MLPDYVKLIAFHTSCYGSLIVMDSLDHYVLWRSDAEPEVIDDALASWLLQQDEVQVLAFPHMCFHRDDLPSAGNVRRI